MKLTKQYLGELRAELDAPTPHSFPKGIIGGSCTRCGARGGRVRSCDPPSSVRVDTTVLRALLDIAEAQDIDVVGKLIEERDAARESEKFLKELMGTKV